MKRRAATKHSRDEENEEEEDEENEEEEEENEDDENNGNEDDENNENGRGVQNDVEISAETVVTILRGLGIARDAALKDAQVWLANLEDQLLVFAQQRQNEEQCEQQPQPPEEENIENHEPIALKYFETIPHLLWWTLSCVFTFGNDQFMRVGESSVPGQAHYDDFLCLMSGECYANAELISALSQVLDCYDSFESQAIPEDCAQTIEETRAAIAKQLAGILDDKGCLEAENFGTQLELGCNLYATMMATVDTKMDEFSMARWRECYTTKCLEMFEWIRLVNAKDCIWDRANTDVDECAVLVPFTKRADLFAVQRARLTEKLDEKMLVDKKRFDADNDHSAIESEFKCPKCGSFRTRQFLMQTRSADEPMTQFWKCFQCNKSGREN